MKAKDVTVVILALTLVLATAVFAGAISNSDLSRLSTQKIGQNQFKFYVAKGTFGDINRHKDIIVPEGTVMEGVIDLIIYRFRLTNTVTLPATSSSELVSGTMIQGRKVSLPTGTINKHYFLGYAKALNKLLLITNPNPL